ncbi:MAG: flagellar basal body-associated FliL family protein [Planctomycetota bacterium]
MTGEEEEQKEQQEEPVKKKSRLISALVFVAIGAAVGGAGVAIFTPPPVQQEDTGNRLPELELVEHDDIMKFLVNPQAERGGRITARIGFRFVCRRDKHKKKQVNKSIKDYWNKAYSRCLMVISNQDVKFLATAEGKQALRKTLVDELSLTLFPDGIATIEDILWTEYFLQ